MMRFFCSLALLCVLPLQAAVVPVLVGNETVTIITDVNGPGKAFVHLHQNETTALKAAQMVLKEAGGSLLTLRHSGQRNVVFYLHKKRYEFDPNRIFTDAGIKKTLTQFGSYSKPAHKEVKKLADQIKSFIPKGKVIAVHNNRGYSLKDYYPGHSLASDAKDLNVSDKSQHRNFFLVTKKHAYERLKALHFNSVLQSSKATDDGSLSIYLAANEYINVEAGYHQLSAQINMLHHA